MSDSRSCINIVDRDTAENELLPPHVFASRWYIRPVHLRTMDKNGFSRFLSGHLVPLLWGKANDKSFHSLFPSLKTYGLQEGRLVAFAVLRLWGSHPSSGCGAIYGPQLKSMIRLMKILDVCGPKALIRE